MRGIFFRTLAEIAARDDRILLLSGDLGFMAIEPFSDRFPARFFNMGVAEQNMVGVATGLAEAGFLPYVYSIATFAALRPYEFIRNGPLAHQLPVRIVGVGGGFEYGHAGPTHHGLEDVGAMRLQPGMKVFVPADSEQTRTILECTWDLPGPIYYRLGKRDDVKVPGLNARFETGRVQLIREGTHIVVFALGAIACQVLQVAETLSQSGLECSVAVVASINPCPTGDLVDLLTGARSAVSVETHYTTGGLGSMISEIITAHGLACPLLRIGISKPFDGVSGSQEFLEKRHALDPPSMARSIVEAFTKAGGRPQE